MPLPGKYSPVDIKPLTGFFDVRSSPDEVVPGTWRWRQNFSVSDKDGNGCRPGWTKLFSNDAYNNEDLHDQLIGLQEYYDDRQTPYEPQSDITTFFPPGNDINGIPYCGTEKKLRGNGRQPITLLFPATSTGGERKLIAGTQNRLYELNEGKGNWRIISDKYGGPQQRNGIPERRWMAAQVEDVIVFTNNYDPPLAHIFDQQTFGCSMQAVSEISSLTEIGLSKAGMVAAWKGVIILGDVEMDGQRFQHRIVWSDFKRGTSFVRSNTSVAGFDDLSPNERILCGEALGDVFLIYTTKSIWQMRYVGGAQVFTFQSLYSEPKHGAMCLAYRFTLASDGQQHLYLGRDGVYAFNLFLPQPERVEWMFAASGEIFDTIDDTRCDSHTAGFNPTTKEYWISWTEQGQAYPTRSLVYNTRYQTDDIVDHGFTAYCSYQPDKRPTLLQWLQDNLICLRSEIAAMPDLLTPAIKEGGYCIPEEVTDCASQIERILTTSRQQTGAVVDCATAAGDFEPLVADGEYLTTMVQNAAQAICQDRTLPIYTSKAKTLEGGIVVEDYDAANADEKSLCTLLANSSIEDICQECETPGVFVMASAVDWCLKEYGTAFYRERCTNCSACGTYVRDGYKRIMRSSALDLGWPREDKQVRSVEIEYDAQQQALPSAVQMRIGYSAQAVDSNKAATGRCALVWRDLKPKNLECLSYASADEHIKNGTRPNRTLSWTFLFTGRYLYLEMSMDGINGNVAFSRLSMEVRQRPRSITSG